MNAINRFICLWPMYFMYRMLFPFFEKDSPWYSYYANGHPWHGKPMPYAHFRSIANDLAVTLGFMLWLLGIQALMVVVIYMRMES